MKYNRMQYNIKQKLIWELDTTNRKSPRGVTRNKTAVSLLVPLDEVAYGIPVDWNLIFFLNT